MRWITAHWELKLVAGVLAVALWIYTSGQVRVERTVTVMAAEAPVRGLPADYQVVQLRPREFKVRLSVPMSRQAEVEMDTLVPRLEVRADQLGTGIISFPLTSALLHLPNDIRIQGTEPEQVRELELQVERIVEGQLPVDPPRLTGLADGLGAEATLDTTMVRVYAPATVLERLRTEGYRVRYQDIPLGHVPGNLAATREERCSLIPLMPSPEAAYRLLQNATAVIRVHPIDQERRTVTLPVAIIATPELWRSAGIELVQPRVAIAIRGPRNLMRDLRPERDLTAAVLVPEDVDPNAVHDLPIRLLGPAWIDSDPVQVSVAVSKAKP